MGSICLNSTFCSMITQLYLSSTFQAAELKGYSLGEIDMALTSLADPATSEPGPDSVPASPLLHWLDRDLVQLTENTVSQVQCTHRVHVRAEEARAAILACGPNLQQAAQRCAETRRKQV